MFVDRAKITVKAGDGGNGCESYYFQRMLRNRRRDGGDGGNGGDIIISADGNVHTLLDVTFRRHFKAENGAHGSSNTKRGHDGQPYVIPVPCGTIVRNAENGLLIRDIDRAADSVIVARGGCGGRGNAKGRESTPGSPGQEITVSLELKLIADIGLVGFPNAGKSSLLNIVSNAQSRVAAFPFTTLQPVLGVITDSAATRRLVMADMPGIVPEAHKGRGLGLHFLRHIERTKLLVLVLDMAGTDGREPGDDLVALLHELACYDRRLLQRPRLLVANKMDMPAAAGYYAALVASCSEQVFALSCVTGSGIDGLRNALFDTAAEFGAEQADAD